MFSFRRFERRCERIRADETRMSSGIASGSDDPARLDLSDRRLHEPTDWIATDAAEAFCRTIRGQGDGRPISTDPGRRKRHGRA
jgi:hypothetical protein